MSSEEDVPRSKADVGWKLRFNSLANNLEMQYGNEIFKYEEEVNHMNYISAIEQRGIDKGLQTGMHQERIKTALRMLEKGYPINLITYITRLTKDEITPLYKEAMKVT